MLSRTILKCNDWRYLIQTGYLTLNICKNDKKRLLRSIKSDAEFLARLGIIDYSLLIGIHDKSKGGSPEVLDVYIF